MRVSLDGSPYHMVLKADLEKITVFTSSEPLLRGCGVTVDLSKRSIGDLFFPQILQGLYVVSIALPLGSGDPVVVADQVFRNLYGMPQDGNLFVSKGNKFHMSWHRVHRFLSTVEFHCSHMRSKTVQQAVIAESSTAVW